MSGYRTVSADTSEKTDRVYFTLLREKSPEEKFRQVVEITQMVEMLSEAGIRLRHPQASEREVNLRLAVLRLGPEWTRKIWGWDPAVQGY